MDKKPLTFPDSTAPAVKYPGMPGSNQNPQPDQGYQGKGSAPLSSKEFWTGGPSDISGGH